MIQRMFHTPEGVRDVYNGECQRKQFLTRELKDVVHSYGYCDIETPTFEYFDVFSREVGTTPSKDLYKFFDREGNTLVLRPDFTPSVARAAAKYFLEDGFPVRLCYQGLKESTEMGVELIGDDSIDADAEILTMTVEMLKKTGLSEFQISVGQVDFFKSLIEEAHMSEETVMELRELISNKNHFGVEELIASQKLPSRLEQAFLRLPQLFGSSDILQEAKELTDNPRALAAVRRLEQIYEILKLYGADRYVSFDLGMLSKYKYYTGIIFQGYTYGSGSPLVKGGRYDSLMGHFLRPAPAIGFALVMEQVMNALERQNISTDIENRSALILFEPKARACALQLAREKRALHIPVTCMAMDTIRSREQYIEYGEKNHYHSILLVDENDKITTIERKTDQ